MDFDKSCIAVGLITQKVAGSNHASATNQIQRNPLETEGFSFSGPFSSNPPPTRPKCPAAQDSRRILRRHIRNVSRGRIESLRPSDRSPHRAGAPGRGQRAGMDVCEPRESRTARSSHRPPRSQRRGEERLGRIRYHLRGSVLPAPAESRERRAGRCAHPLYAHRCVRPLADEPYHDTVGAFEARPTKRGGLSAVNRLHDVHAPPASPSVPSAAT